MAFAPDNVLILISKLSHANPVGRLRGIWICDGKIVSFWLTASSKLMSIFLTVSSPMQWRNLFNNDTTDLLPVTEFKASSNERCFLGMSFPPEQTKIASQELELVKRVLREEHGPGLLPVYKIL